MNILIIGNGAREHVFAVKSQSQDQTDFELQDPMLVFSH